MFANVSCMFVHDCVLLCMFVYVCVCVCLPMMAYVCLCLLRLVYARVWLPMLACGWACVWSVCVRTCV